MNINISDGVDHHHETTSDSNNNNTNNNNTTKDTDNNNNNNNIIDINQDNNNDDNDKLKSSESKEKDHRKLRPSEMLLMDDDLNYFPPIDNNDLPPSIPSSPEMSPSSSTMLSSPPSSPGLLPKLNKISSRDDEFALASDSDVWSLSSSGSNYYPNYNMSSDSYFSQHRESLSSDRGRKFDNLIPNNNISNQNQINKNNRKSPTSNSSFGSGSSNGRRRRSDVSVRSVDYNSDRDYSQQQQQQYPLSSQQSTNYLQPGFPNITGPLKDNRRSSRRSGDSNFPDNQMNDGSFSYSNMGSGNSNGGGVSGNTGTPNSRSHSARRRSHSRSREEIAPAAKIFKNLLILEESLRQQYTEQKLLRRKYFCFFMTIGIFSISSGYQLISSSSISISNYMKLIYQIIFVITIVTLVLFYLSGEYNRTIVRPRKFISTTNKGLRQLNLRIVKLKTKNLDLLSDLSRDLMRFLIKFLNFYLKFLNKFDKIFNNLPILNSILINFKKFLIMLNFRSQPRVGAIEVKLVLNPRVFNTATREQWELYRNEFWSKEGARRRKALLNQYKIN
ncbi:hypothetical protein B5S28_g2399 [[Candida] boidinii]|nr:hypothetical protein B5S28_g2399 [[Candida] boidinii]OWB60251.1 hypothetical protein B5S29_g1122 [[Candida] boidinii]